MANYQSAYTGAQHDLYTTRQSLIDLIYPVGAIYMSVNSASPSTLFGGTWEQIQDTFLLAAGQTYTAGSNGGNASHTHGYAHTHTTPATTTDSHTLTETELPVISGSMSWHGQEHGTHVYNISGHVTGTIVNGMFQTTGQTSGAYSYSNTGFKFGGGGGHTHGQKATTTNSQSTSTTDSSSSLPPYLAVYVWQRTA